MTFSCIKPDFFLVYLKPPPQKTVYYFLQINSSLAVCRAPSAGKPAQRRQYFTECTDLKIFKCSKTQKIEILLIILWIKLYK